MPKIVLPDTNGGFNISTINDNFQAIADGLNNKVLYRDNPVGETNTLETDTDVNGKRLYNLPVPTLPSEAARLQDVINATIGIIPAQFIPFTPYLDVGATNVQEAIEELKDDLNLQPLNSSITTEKLADQSITNVKVSESADIDSSKLSFLQTGVGAVRRSVDSRFKDFITVFDFMTPALISDAKLPVPILDHTSAVQAALTAASGKSLILGPYNFRCTAGLNITGSVYGMGATIKFVGTTISKLLNQTTEADIVDLTIDGSGVTNCENGLYVDTDFVQTKPCNYNLKIKNISNTDNTKGCNGALFVKGSLAVNLKSRFVGRIDVDGVTATANGVIGDTGGSSCGILVSINGSGTDNQFIFRDCIINNILPAEDSGGIQFFVADHTSPTALGTYLIENCTISNARKRGIKVQSQNTTVRDVLVYGQNTEVGFDAYAVNTIFDSCRYTQGSSTAFRTSGSDTKFINCKADATTQQPLMRLEGGAVNPMIRDTTLINNATFATGDNNLCLIDNVATTTFENSGLACTSNTGTGISIAGTCNVRFRGSSISGVESGVLLAFSSGTFKIDSDSIVSASFIGFRRAGATSQVVIANDSLISAPIPFSLQGVGNTARVEIDNCRIFGDTHGILSIDNSRITNNKIVSAAFVGTGISAGNSVIRNNQVTGYSVGISFPFTTTAEVADNVTIGSVLPYETTGYTPFVNTDNFSR